MKNSFTVGARSKCDELPPINEFCQETILEGLGHRNKRITTGSLDRDV